MQKPFTHSFVLQAVPQAPQFAPSVARSTHVPPHSSFSAGQRHVPSTQVPPSPQSASEQHSPCGMHDSPHSFSPSGQEHSPSRHRMSTSQRLPQLPQCNGSVCRSKHFWPHFFLPPLHFFFFFRLLASAMSTPTWVRRAASPVP